LTEQTWNNTLRLPEMEAKMVWLKDIAAGLGVMAFLASAWVLTGAVQALLA